jgi:translation initiation factor 2B subunit (eIF-2B alpha/beta/delta family)
MVQEKRLGDELKQMYLASQLPVSMEEQINHLADQLRNGQITIGDLQGEEAGVQERIQEAMSRIENENSLT